MHFYMDRKPPFLCFQDLKKIKKAYFHYSNLCHTFMNSARRPANQDFSNKPEVLQRAELIASIKLNQNLHEGSFFPMLCQITCIKNVLKDEFLN